MITTRRTAESVARRFDRSRFLKRSAASISGFVAAGTVAGIFPPKALANHCAKTVYGNCSCVPVGGRYCNNCQDAGCPSDCGAYFGACPAWAELSVLVYANLLLQLWDGKLLLWPLEVL